MASGTTSRQVGPVRSRSRRGTYFDALDLPKTTTNRNSPQEAALDRAHELRKFEIENYWKRSNYFWLFQAAAITLTGVIYSHSADDPLLLLSSGLGVITAQVGWLTARGSKFWQSNWEAHVDFLENGLEGKLTQIILYEKDAVRSSVSRVNERLYGALLIAWLLLFANHALLLVFGAVLNPSPRIVGLVSALLLAGALLFVSIGTRSSLNPAKQDQSGLWDKLRNAAPKKQLTIYDRSSGVTTVLPDQPASSKTS